MLGVEERLIPHVREADAVFAVCGYVDCTVRRELRVISECTRGAHQRRVLHVAVDLLERLGQLTDYSLLVGVEVLLIDLITAQDDGEILAARADGAGEIDAAELGPKPVRLGHAAELLAIRARDVVLVS